MGTNGSVTLRSLPVQDQDAVCPPSASTGRIRVNTRFTPTDGRTRGSPLRSLVVMEHVADDAGDGALFLFAEFSGVHVDSEADRARFVPNVRLMVIHHPDHLRVTGRALDPHDLVTRLIDFRAGVDRLGTGGVQQMLVSFCAKEQALAPIATIDRLLGHGHLLHCRGTLGTGEGLAFHSLGVVCLCHAIILPRECLGPQ